MDVIESLRANQSTSTEVDVLINRLIALRQELRNAEFLAQFNQLFNVSIACIREILADCDSVEHYEGGFAFTAPRKDNWEAHVWINYVKDESKVATVTDVIFEAERYFRWSFKEHGYGSLGDFQGRSLIQYLPGSIIETVSRRESIVHDVETCQELTRQLTK